MLKKGSVSFAILAVLLSLIGICSVVTCRADEDARDLGRTEGVWASGPLAKRGERKSLVATEYGEISAVRISDNINGSYLLHFFTLEPNALFLPVILHADMVFYVHTGSGRLSWTDEDDTKHADLRRGDVYRLQQGSVFFIQSNLETETERQKLRIHAIFVNSNDLREPVTGPYSSIREMVTGFGRNILQAAFKVPEEVIDELLNGTKQPAFIHGVPTTKKKGRDTEAQFIRSVLDSRSFNIFESNKKKKLENVKLFNIFKEDRDFENCNGWSTVVTRKKLHALHGTNIGALMVNLTTGSMMGPHWNPMATEIAIVLQGRGIVRVVCSDVSDKASCKNTRFFVEGGDVFVVPRFHPMAQMAFNNDTFVFIGFSTSTKKNHPQFLAGQASVLRTLDRDVLAMAFNVTNTTLDQFLAPQRDSVILGCTSCAEEELRVMQEEVERKQEEAREWEEEAAREREEARKREEEHARKREEEKAKKHEEERRKREEEEEEARKKEEEARRKEEEEAEVRRKEEEEGEARRQEEAARKKEEEEAEARRKEEEEAEVRRQEEAARKKEEEEAARRKEEEEAEARRQEEEERERQEEEAEARRQEEETKRQEEEEERARKEAEARRQEEEAEARRQEEERRREEEEGPGRREEEERQRREAEEAARRQEEERRRQEEQAGREQEEEQQGGGGASEEEQAAEQERRMEEEAAREAEEAARQREGGGGGVRKKHMILLGF